MTARVPSSIEDLDIVLIGETMLAEAEEWVLACECCVDNAVITIDYLLDALTGCDPLVTEYVMCRPARCPSCSSPINEKTLVAV